ncbi:MAG: F0F1 ATP synthase subunit delta [Candidatus Omnitrophica bacterium]|nr:F0F1 ATP synthase subunit delta [Candidatus Omnitrophota bacterium]
MIITAVIMIQAVIFIVLIFVLRHFMQGHVTGAVGHLRKLNDELMKQQSELRQKISAAEKEYQSKMAVIQREVSTVQAEARQEAVKLVEEAKSRAMQERENLINDALATKEKMRQEIMAEMENVAITHSKELMGEFFSGELRRLVHECLVRDLVMSLREIKWEQYQIDTNVAEIKVAIILNEDLRMEIQTVLKEKTKKDFSFKEEVDTGLIGGLVLKCGTLVIDGSLTHRLNEAAARLKKETARRYQGRI